MQRLVLAVLLLAALAGIAFVLALGLRATVQAGIRADRDGPVESGTVQKLAYVALLLLIVGVSTGLVGGL